MMRPFRDEVDGEHILLGPERRPKRDEDLLVPGLHDARGGDGVLRLQRGEQRRHGRSQARQLLLREFDVDRARPGRPRMSILRMSEAADALADIDDVVPAAPGP
jgi:hypothetical protein